MSENAFSYFQEHFGIAILGKRLKQYLLNFYKIGKSEKRHAPPEDFSHHSDLHSPIIDKTIESVIARDRCPYEIIIRA